jgi:tetratricopeptide (TPR) repeat protein
MTTRKPWETASNTKLVEARLRVPSPSGSGRPMSRQELAEAVNAWQWQYEKVRDYLDETDIGSYERGDYRWPRQRRRDGLRAVLGARTDAELGFYRNRQPRSAPATADEPRQQRPMPSGVPSATPSREIGAAEVRDVSPYAQEWAQRVRHGVADPARHADVSVVDVFRLHFETAKAVDGHFGAAAALSTARGVVDVVESMIPAVPEVVRRELSMLGAEAAEFVGWLYRDLADTAQAIRWYDRAMEYAQLCGHLPMQGFVLLRKSQLAYESGDGHRVRMLADAAIEGPWQLPPALLAEALLQIARGNAMIGQDVDMDIATRQAQDVADGEDLTLREASCWIEAGRPERAAQIYDERLGVDGLSTRDVGYYRARQAIALAQAEQPDLAAAQALDALSTSVRTGSTRTYSSVRKAHRILGPWHGRDTVAALGEALSAAALPSRRQP